MKTYAEELIEQGMHEGEVAGERKVLLKQLRQRFGTLDAETEQRIAAATSEQLETWTMRVLSASTLAQVLPD